MNPHTKLGNIGNSSKPTSLWTNTYETSDWRWGVPVTEMINQKGTTIKSAKLYYKEKKKLEEEENCGQISPWIKKINQAIASLKQSTRSQSTEV